MLGRISIAAGAGALALALSGGGGGAGAQAQAPCPNADSGPEAGAAALAAATECLIAAERAAAGVPALRPNAALRRSAEGHAADMVARRFLASTSPDGRDQEERAIRAGYGAGDVRITVGEAFGFGTGSEATPRANVARWRADPGFKRVILDPRARDLGVGVALGSPRGPAGDAATYVADFGRETPLPAPRAGRTVGVGYVSGIVRLAVPGSRRFARLHGKRIVPVGSRLDTRDGVVRVRSATGGGAARQAAGGPPQQRAIFFDGMFRVTQARSAVTEIRLVERLAPCPRRSRSSGARATADAEPSARKRRPRKRRVWGDGKGRFRTRGQFASATVVGTRWLVEDSCAGTRVRVTRGTVRVTSRRTGRSRTVRAGRSLLIRRR